MSWLARSELPFVDMMAAHLNDFADFSCSAQEYLDRYYIGHYNPMGNLFCAFAMRSALLELLRSPPPNAVVTGNQASEQPLAFGNAVAQTLSDLEVLRPQRANLSHSHALARLLAGTGGDEAAKAGEWFHNVIFDDQHGLALDAYVPPGPVSTATAAVCHHADRVTQSVAAIRARTLASCWCTAAASCAARRSPTSTRFSRP